MSYKRCAAGWLLTAILLLNAGTPGRSMAAARGPHPTPDMRWWQHDRFGMFITWGLYSVLGGVWHGKQIPGFGEWIMNNAHLPLKQYKQLAQRFNPVDFNADRWVRTARDAGMKYIVITAKFHDGFCMFPTCTTAYNVVHDTPWHTDPLAQLAAACKKYDVRFCTYYSIMDWSTPFQAPDVDAPGDLTYNPTKFVPGGRSKYLTYMERQLHDLIKQYHPGAMWFDGGWMQGWNGRDGKIILDYLRRIDPQLIVNNRLAYGGDYRTPEQFIPSAYPVPWETCMTMNHTWGYKSADHQWKSAATLLQDLIQCASGGGNYLLDVGPTGRGDIPQPELERLKIIGRWMKINHAAIYGTQGTPFYDVPKWGRITSRPGHLYLEVYHWPTDRHILLPMNNPITHAFFLADPSQLISTTKVFGGQILHLPRDGPDPLATVLVVDYTGSLSQCASHISQQPDGAINLPAIDAVISPGANARLIGQRWDTQDCWKKTMTWRKIVSWQEHQFKIPPHIGHWTGSHDSIEWTIDVHRAGLFRGQLSYACAHDAGGRYEVIVGDHKVMGTVHSTGGWNHYETHSTGILHIDRAGKVPIVIRPTGIKGKGLMNLRGLRLVPEKE